MCLCGGDDDMIKRSVWDALNLRCLWNKVCWKGSWIYKVTSGENSELEIINSGVVNVYTVFEAIRLDMII